MINWSLTTTLAQRLAVLLPTLCCAFLSIAQTTLPEQLRCAIETEDTIMFTRLYNNITDADLAQLQDSALFDYHYIGACVNCELTETPNHEKGLYHLLEAKRLSDTSLGTLSVGYMEIMDELGSEYIEMEKYDDALSIYREAIVKSMAIRNSAPQKFGTLILGVQECYEYKGWFNEIPAHLMDAWEFWTKNEQPFCTINYYPLWSLRLFYSSYKMYEKALKISDMIIEFITKQVSAEHPEMAEELYMRGNILSNMGKNIEAIDTYCKGLYILKANKKDSEEIYGSICGNLLMKLVSTDRKDEYQKTLKEYKEYSNRTNNPDNYKNALFSVASTLNNRCHYTEALGYINELLKQNCSEKEMDRIKQLAENIRYDKEVIESMSELETHFYSYSKGSDAWFDVAQKLANAYLIKNDIDKSDKVLESMYEVFSSDQTKGCDFQYWVLKNLYNNAYNRGEYKKTFKYATEEARYVSTPSFPEEYHYYALNDIIVAKLRSNELEGIDNDLERVGTYFLNRFGKNSYIYAIYLHNKGRAYQLQNRLEEAKDLLLKSIIIQKKVNGKVDERTYSYFTEVDNKLGDL